MGKETTKETIKPESAGLIVGAGLVAAINLIGMLFHPAVSFYDFVIVVYFLTGLILGCSYPELSWKEGIWFTIPWIIWIFFNIAGAGFKDGVWVSILWLLFYSFPLLPACAGAYLGTKAVHGRMGRQSLLRAWH